MTAQATAPLRQSRVGKRPIPIPKGVTVNFTGGKVDVQGPKGKLARELPAEIRFSREGDAITVVADASPRDLARLQGLGRALVASMIKGAAEGYERILELVGTGYRCEVKGKVVNFSLGFSHPTKYELPAQVTAVVPPDSKGTVLILTSPDKEALGMAAAKIRGIRPPEPYGGKGIRYRGEAIRRKAGKAGKAGAGKK
jgi:large subunit ribosomal protein L6